MVGRRPPRDFPPGQTSRGLGAADRSRAVPETYLRLEVCAGAWVVASVTGRGTQKPRTLSLALCLCRSVRTGMRKGRQS